MSTHKAVRLTKARGAVVETLDKLPSASDLGANEVLIRNVAVASNPKDWKLAKYGVFEGIEGNDVAGIVEEVGSSVTKFQKGDRVIAFTFMAKHDKYGAYQALTVAPEWTTAKLDERVSFEDGATIPLAATTAFVGLFDPDQLGLPEPTAEGGKAEGAEKYNVLIWGASSSVGAYVTQLALIAGFNVVAVAGAAQDAVIRDLGVPKNKVVDYRDSSNLISNLINAADGKPFTHVYDCISTEDTVSTIIDLLSTSPNDKVEQRFTTVLPTQYDDESAKAQLQKTKSVKHNRTLCGVVHKPDDQCKQQFGQRWFTTVTTWLNQGKFKPNKVHLVDGGLDGIPQGLKLLEENKISNKKVVARIQDTK